MGRPRKMYRLPNDLQIGSMKVCKTCGKEFNVLVEQDWVYKRSHEHTAGGYRDYFCSWSCLRKYDQEREGKKKKSIMDDYEY
jgi:hypothetical protein